MEFEQVAMLCIFCALVDIGLSLRLSNFSFFKPPPGGEWLDEKTFDQMMEQAPVNHQQFSDDFYGKRAGRVVDKYV